MPGCITRYKDTNLKAIHNQLVVTLSVTRLYYQIQRYKFESNSQPLRHAPTTPACCITRYKDTNLKAIHNHILEVNLHAWVVLPDTKIQIWKQFTTHHGRGLRWSQLYYQIQRYKFESNSQPRCRCRRSWFCCITRYKDTNLKAIHNCPNIVDALAVLYYQIQRYKFESNSQRCLHFTQVYSCCITRYKDTNLKAIHNASVYLILSCMLYYQIQRYKFESNSQLNCTSLIYPPGCITRYKDTNLKAIHNGLLPRHRYRPVVLPDTKIQIWKQFTTCSRQSCPVARLYYQIQRYKFESNSQQT